MKRRNFLTTLASLAFVLVAPATSFAQQSGSFPDVVLGETSAPSQIIEYGSFTCVHCGNFTKESFPDVRAELIETGEASFVFREVYADKYGLMAGMIAHAASDGRTDEAAYYRVVDALMIQQDDWAFGSQSEDEIQEKLIRIGKEHGNDPDLSADVFLDEQLAETLIQTFLEHAKRDEIVATPTFLIDGETLPNMSADEMIDFIKK